MSFEDIIEQVRVRPELWKNSCGGKRNREYQRKIWMGIARMLDIEETLLKKRWKHLKDQYRKELKKRNGQDDDTNQWKYYRSMEFMRNELLHSACPEKSAIGEVEEEQQIDLQTDNFDPAAMESRQSEFTLKKHNSLSKKVDKLNERLEKHITACGDDARDPDYMFLMSILPSIKKLSEIQKLYFRGRVNDWLLETMMTQNDYGPEYSNDCTGKMFVTSELCDSKMEHEEQ